ncbi:nicotinate-nucleotide pyrophosphorylase (nadC) [Archaeoglobus fulgidus DSM 4304]|uniref:Probable nicotinate-nucleotide pyrophosphorylase [carboxylating] n=2 Tax=Archaeoglobus fulgidus TaxID=2234 RepID=NADC_ARCFU|nr:RecName: Full=Probable nicotinate-nucleotide pyrophosphorylase [carboxylating]; AltName: Full=Quinolinate phosphoribosyltransferase [decarboxylating]; Short=QAPRTase [Archaeoglobus fulgidus DSM 4304]AAB89414.1 nicotinate-nucleotide pyrophosphorylase (nadC) [Archaeoglobus fulgidus DSM 4304]
MPYGDVTAIPTKDVEAVIVSKGEGVLAGVGVVKILFDLAEIVVMESKKDGEPIKPGDVVMRLRGKSDSILATERLAINILMRMSGIATATAKMVERARRVNPKVVVAATRKTTPGFRIFEKMAVEIGGGDAHRFSLSDCLMLKDNHIAVAGSLERAMKVKRSFTKKLEVEVGSVGDAIKAAEFGADIIMLDNFTPEMVAEAVEELRRRGLREKVIIEVSGSVTPENVAEFAAMDVDVISSGYITHSAPALDFSLRVLQ